MMLPRLSWPAHVLFEQNLNAVLSVFKTAVQRRGIGILTGEPGCGKSFCLRCFTSSLNKSLYKVIYIPITTLTVKEFYMALCDGLIIAPAYKKVKQIQEDICSYSSKNITPVIIIDEVQFLSNSILDDFRLMKPSGSV